MATSANVAPSYNSKLSPIPPTTFLIANIESFKNCPILVKLGKLNSTVLPSVKIPFVFLMITIPGLDCSILTTVAVGNATAG